MTLGFTLMGFYDSLEYERIPLEIITEVTYAPQFSSYADSDGSLEFAAAIGFHIFNNRNAVLLKYRYTLMQFDDNGDDWEMWENAAAVGLWLRF